MTKDRTKADRIIDGVVRPFVCFALDRFFSRIEMRGASIEKSGPLLIVANHPNMALDPLLIAGRVDRPLWFLAKSTLFSGGLRERFLRACRLIPIQRRQDHDAVALHNAEAFRAVADALSCGSAVVIFPEGVSLGERVLAPLKTGAARMALQAEDNAAFALNLKIQPIGLTYSDLVSFRSAVTIVVGAPIAVQAYREQYAADALESVRALTAEIEAGIRAVTVEVEQPEERRLVEKIAALYRAAGKGADDYERFRAIAANVALHPDTELRARIEDRLDSYRAVADLFALDHAAHTARSERERWLLIATPLMLWGIAAHYLPYRLVGALVRRKLKHPVENATYKLFYGVVIFFVWYLVLILSAGVLSESALGIVMLLIITAASGLLVNQFLDQWKLLLLAWLWPGATTPCEVLTLLRSELIAELDSLRAAE